MLNKNKCFDNKATGDDLLPNLLTESEKIYFREYNLQDGICEECKQDHSFKSYFKGVKTSIEHLPNLIPLIFKEDTMKNE